MNLYEKKIAKDLKKWHKEIQKEASLFDTLSKAIQKKMQNLVPEKAREMMTTAIEKMTKTIMLGSNILTVKEDTESLSLAERDYLVQEKFAAYEKMAVLQGVGFGAGGILLSMADFPALLSIKVKFLFDAARLYGYDVTDKKERLFMLYIFQLAFSSHDHRIEIFDKLANWDAHVLTIDDIEWDKFQTEYRDYIDIAKMLQLLPLVGAVAGGTANYRLMNRLKEYTMNCYRMRILGNIHF